MERILSYTLTGKGFTPAEPQFAGIQGSHRATALEITPDGEVASFIEEKRAQGKEMCFRIDVINEAGQTVSMKQAPIEQLTQPFYLTRQMTASGLDCVAVLCITARDEAGETEVYKAQMRLYFEQSKGGIVLPEEKEPADILQEKYTECEQKLEEKTQSLLSSIDLKAEVVRQMSTDIANRHGQAASLANEAKAHAQSASASAVTAEQEAMSTSAMLAEVRRIAHSAADLTARSEAAAARADKDAATTEDNLAQVTALAEQTGENAEKALAAAERAEESVKTFSQKQDLFAEVEEQTFQRVVRADKNLSFEVGENDQKGTIDVGHGYVSAFSFGDMEFSSKIGGIVLRGKAEEGDMANVDVCGCRIRNLAEPKNPADAVNKEYFDAVLGDIDTALEKVISVQDDYIGGDT